MTILSGSEGSAYGRVRSSLISKGPSLLEGPAGPQRGQRLIEETSGQPWEAWQGGRPVAILGELSQGQSCKDGVLTITRGMQAWFDLHVTDREGCGSVVLRSHDSHGAEAWLCSLDPRLSVPWLGGVTSLGRGGGRTAPVWESCPLLLP